MCTSIDPIPAKTGFWDGDKSTCKLCKSPIFAIISLLLEIWGVSVGILFDFFLKDSHDVHTISEPNNIKFM